MAETNHLQSLLARASVAPDVFDLRQDYRVLLIAVEGIIPGPSDSSSENLLRAAETSARTQVAKQSVTEIPHVAAWRDAYKAFGAKPNKSRNSLEALTRRVVVSTTGAERACGGLPRVNRLTDIYNGISVKTQVPFGGEDLQKYSGPPRCVRATGNEDFETVASGKTVIERPNVGEVVWCDDVGVTCRCWNWRQSPRTALTADTTRALFILDALEPCSDEALVAAGDELVEVLRGQNKELLVARRIVRRS